MRGVLYRVVFKQKAPRSGRWSRWAEMDLPAITTLRGARTTVRSYQRLARSMGAPFRYRIRPYYAGDSQQFAFSRDLTAAVY